MSRTLSLLVSAVAVAAALGLSGCSKAEQDASPQTTPSPTPVSSRPAAAAQNAPLPSPDALAGVLYRLADPAVPGLQKLNLVEGSEPENGAVYDAFANALVTGGYSPVTFGVRDIRWSDRDPADVVANVDVATPDPHGPRFGFPMEFKPYQDGWQLSARTAGVLLAFRSGSAGPPTPGR